MVGPACGGSASTRRSRRLHRRCPASPPPAAPAAPTVDRRAETMWVNGGTSVRALSASPPRKVATSDGDRRSVTVRREARCATLHGARPLGREDRGHPSVAGSSRVRPPASDPRPTAVRSIRRRGFEQTNIRPRHDENCRLLHSIQFTRVLHRGNEERVRFLLIVPPSARPAGLRVEGPRRRRWVPGLKRAAVEATMRIESTRPAVAIRPTEGRDELHIRRTLCPAVSLPDTPKEKIHGTCLCPLCAGTDSTD